MSSETPTVERHNHQAISINIFINDSHYRVSASSLTGAQLASLGGIHEGNQLFLEVPGPGEDRPVGREEPIELKAGMRFYDVPAGNLG